MSRSYRRATLERRSRISEAPLCPGGGFWMARRIVVITMPVVGETMISASAASDDTTGERDTEPRSHATEFHRPKSRSIISASGHSFANREKIPRLSATDLMILMDSAGINGSGHGDRGLFSRWLSGGGVFGMMSFLVTVAVGFVATVISSASCSACLTGKNELLLCFCLFAARNSM